jgi:hypothetical protein
MNTSKTQLHSPGRSLATECFLLCVGLAAAWLFLIRPMQAALAQKQHQSESMRTSIDTSTLTESDLAQKQATLATLTLQRDALTTWGRGAADSGTRMYDEINRLAASEGVKVLRLEPTSARRVSPPKDTQTNANPAPKGSDEVIGAEVSGHRLSVQGEAQRVARFLSACQTTLSGTCVSNFRMHPGSRSDLVEATLETLHIQLVREGDKFARAKGSAS